MNRKISISLLLLLVLAPLLGLIPVVPAHAAGTGNLIGTTTDTESTSYEYQRKTFYAAGRFWVFYGEDGTGGYRSSTDNVTWNAFTSIGSVTYGDRCLSVYFDGTYVHYARYDWSNEDLYYRRGIPPSNGIISWSAAEQLVYDGDVPPDYPFYSFSHPMITVDTNGYAWIAVRRSKTIDEPPSEEWRPYIFKNANNDGTWTTAGGFPYELSDAHDSIWWIASVVPLTSGKVYAIYSARSIEATFPRGQLWNGTAWEAEENITTALYMEHGSRHSAVAIGDVIHLVFESSETPTRIVHVIRTDSWSAPVEVDTATPSDTAPPCLTKVGSRLYVFYKDGDNRISYRIYGSGSWGTEETLVTEPDGIHLLGDTACITCFYESSNDKIGILYMTKAESPYDVKYMTLDIVGVDAGIHNPDLCDSDRWVFEGRTQYIFYVNISHPLGGGENFSAGMGFYDSAGDWYSFFYSNETERITLVSPDDGISVSLKDVETGTEWLYVNFTVIVALTIGDTSDVDLYVRWITPNEGDSGWYSYSVDYFNIYREGGFTTLEASGWAGRSPGGDTFEIFAADTRTQNIMSIEDFDVRTKPLPPGVEAKWFGSWLIAEAIVPADESPLLDELLGWDFWMSQYSENQTIVVTNRLPIGAGINDKAYYSYPFGLRTLARPITSNGLIAEKEFHRKITPADGEIVYVQIYAMTPQTGNTTGKILITDDGYVDDLMAHAALDSLQVVDLVFAGDGRIRLTNGVAGYIYPATYTGLTWYNFTFEINCTAQNYDMYVDGVLNATDVDFRQKVAGADSVGHISIMDISVAGNYTDIYVDDIKAWTDWDGDYGGEAKATTLFHYLQHWSMSFGFGVEEGREYVKGPSTTPANPDDDYSDHGYVELGWDICIDEVWENNFLVARINITDGVVRNQKESWVEFTITWTQNGTLIKTDVIYGLFEGYKIKTSPGAKDKAQFNWDIWFSNMNTSTVVGGRISSKYFGMSEESVAFVYWGINWQPLDEPTQSACYVDLLDSDDDLHQIKEVSLVRSWVRVFRTNQSTFHYSIQDIERNDFPVAKGIMSSVSTPDLTDTVIATGVPSGIGGFFTATLEAAFGDIANILRFGGTGMFTYFINFADVITGFFGYPTLISTMLGIVTSTIGFLVTMVAEGFMFDALTNIFTVITSTFGHILLWLTRVIGTLTNIFTITWSIIDGTYTGAGVLVDLWATFNWAEWSDAVPLFIIIAWFDSLDSRWRAAGKQGWVGYLIGDLVMVKMFLMLLLDVGTWVIDKGLVLFERIINMIPGL